MTDLERLFFKRNLCVDGHVSPDSDSSFAGDGQFPPSVVFDIDAQRNLSMNYLTRAQAELAMDRILKEST